VRNRRAGAALAAATTTIMLATAGCTEEEKGMQPTATKAEAVQRVETLLKEALAQLPAEVATTTNLSVDGVPCDAPTDGGPAGRIFAERREIIIAPTSGSWSVTEVLPTLAAYWEKSGYKVITDERTDELPRINVETTDGYRVGVDSWDRGDHYDVTVASSSPCVWENGTPDTQ
jgi:hypothetical protein